MLGAPHVGLLPRCQECAFPSHRHTLVMTAVFVLAFRGGMIAPILGGQLLTVDVSLPVYTSVVTFVIAGICVLFLKEAEKSEGEETVILH